MMFFMKVVCILLAVVPQLCFSQCPGPVFFNSPSFTIRGPCPNNTVLAAVGSTVHYRCDYVDTSGLTNLPYWHIQGLTGTPFLQGEGMDHGITIKSTTGDSGHTTVSIPVKEQYLNNSLNIQCGLCSLLVCVGDILNENITSTNIKLVSFGSLYNLHDSIQSSPSLVTLSWSPPPVSTMDYSNISSYFTYEVTLTNQLNSTQAITLTTSTTAANISARDIPDGHDVCGNYSWSVTPIANGGITSRGDTIDSSNSISIPSVPLIKNASFVANLSQCETSQLLSITFEVNSCSGTGLKSTVLVTIGDTVYNRSTRITPVGPNTYAVRSDIEDTKNQFDFESNVSVDIKVENNYGHFEANYEIEDDINFVTCVSIPLIPAPTTSSLAYSTMTTSKVRGTSDTSRHRSDSTSDIYARSTYTRDESSQTTRSEPSVSPGLVKESSKGPIYIAIPVVIFLIVFCVLVLVLVLVLVFYMKNKKSSMKVTSETEYATIEQKNCNGKRKAFMNGNGGSGGVFKYENVSISTCSTPMDVTTPRLPLFSSTASADSASDQHSQEDQVQQQQPQHLPDSEGTYANPMDIQSGPVLVNGLPHRNNSESKAGHQPGRSNTQPLLFSSTNVSFDNPGYSQPMPGVERVVEAEYSEVSFPSKKPSTSSSNDFVNMPGYSEVHFDPKKQRRSWHNSRINSTPKHTTCSSLPATPAHIKINPQFPPPFLKLGGIEETDSGTTGGESGNAVYDDIVFNKENMQSGANSTTNVPEYVAVEEIKKRKVQNQQMGQQQQEQHVLKFDEDMIEMKELPPPTPQHDRTTPPPSASTTPPPPPIPPHPQSPSVPVVIASES